MDLIGQALDDDIFEVTNNPIKDADIRHRHLRVQQNGTSGVPLANQLVSNPAAPVVAFVERDADIDAAAKALVAARFGQQGKSPYAPDVVLVNEWVKKELLAAVVQQSIAFTASSGSQEPRKNSVSLIDEASKEKMSHIVSSSSSGTILDVDRSACQPLFS